jgi:hypothetical protein
MNSKLDANYIVGFVDGEGCFSVTINKHSDNRLEVRLIFEIELREDDLEILERIKETLGCGSIYHLNYERYKKWKPHYKYKVSNFKDISQKIIPFFQKFPLQAKKQQSFEFFCKVAHLIKNKEHLKEKQIEAIRLMREDLNRDSLDALDAHVQWGAE